MAWNLSGLITTSLFVIQSIALSLSDSRVSINLETVSPQADRVLLPAEFHKEAISKKKNTSLIQRLNKPSPSIEICGTPKIISL